jgi:S-adenosylmethionine/arginine decarboxylase-like enzyme
MKRPEGYFGKLLTVDFLGIRSELLVDKELMAEVSRQVISLAAMTIIQGPDIFYYEHPTDPLESGLTGCTILSESHFTFHSFQRSGFLTLDLYSCSDFIPETIISYLKGVFNPTSMETNVHLRGKGY